MKKKTTRSGDRHKKRWVVNLPMSYRKLMAGLASTNRRPLTTEVLIALEAHLQAAGLWPPPEGALVEDQSEE